MNLLEDKVIEAANKVKGSVIAIYSVRYVRDFFFRETPIRGFGSGFIVRGDGYILTNAHVVEGVSKVNVVLEGETIRGLVVGRDPLRDVAVVKVERRGLPSVRLGDSDRIRVGQIVLALGNPFGLTGEPTVTMGVVSAVRRLIKTSRGVFENLIQTDAAINPGNSGGPLVDLKGEVIGINTAIIPYAQGIGFAIPINDAKKAVNDVISYGRIIRPWMGIYCVSLNKNLSTYYELPVSEGCLVVETVPGGPADKAGITSGDIILSIDGKKVSRVEDLTKEVSGREIGEEIVVEVMRGYRRGKARVKLEEAPLTTP